MVDFGHTAAEVIYNRVDSDKPFMGLTTLSGKQPASQEITVAKNYLSGDEHQDILTLRKFR